MPIFVLFYSVNGIMRRAVPLKKALVLGAFT